MLENRLSLRRRLRNRFGCLLIGTHLQGLGSLDRLLAILLEVLLPQLELAQARLDRLPRAFDFAPSTLERRLLLVERRAPQANFLLDAGEPVLRGVLRVALDTVSELDGCAYELERLEAR